MTRADAVAIRGGLVAILSLLHRLIEEPTGTDGATYLAGAVALVLPELWQVGRFAVSRARGGA